MVQSQELEQVDSRHIEDARIILLAGAAAEGDELAFTELYTLLSQRVFNLVLRSVHDRPTAEDLCQEIWLRVHKEIRDLRAPEAMRSWLYRIASRACVDFARSSRGKHRKEEDGIDEFIAVYGREPEEEAILGSEIRMVWQTLGAMAPRQSMALYLKQVDGLSYDEIASILDCSRPTVEALLFRARQSFVRAYHRVESSPGERCEMFSQVMAAVIDNEPTALQRSALESHATDCVSCRPQLVELRRANNAYLALPLLPIGKALALETILAGGGVTGAGIFAAAAGLFGAGALQAKLVLVGAILATAGGAVASGQVDVPGVSEHVAVFESASSDSDAATSHGGAASAGAEDRSVLATTAERLAAVLTGNTPSPLPAGQPPASGSGVGVSVATAEGGEGGGPGENGEDGSDSSTSSASGPDDQGSAGETTSPGQAEPEPDPDPTQTLVTALQEVTDDLTAWVGQTVGEVAVIAGDTLNAVVEPVAELIEPVDSVVEDLTGLSVTETLEDVTNLLPGSDGTPVPLGETVEDIVEPVEDLLADPLAPVEDLLEDPLAPVEDLTGPLLGPLLPGDTPVPPSVTPQPGATPTPEPTATPEEGLCLLGLLLC